MRTDETLEERSQRLFGESLEQVLPRLVKEEGSIQRVAVRLDVFPNAIRHWVKKNGYRLSSKRTLSLEKVADA